MRLTDLNPHWVAASWSPPGAKLGIRFDSPTIPGRIAVFFKNPICGNDAIDLQRLLEAQRDCDHPDYETWLNETHIGKTLWSRTGDSFESLSLIPSIDCSEWGGWHGFITNGGIS